MSLNESDLTKVLPAVKAERRTLKGDATKAAFYGRAALREFAPGLKKAVAVGALVATAVTGAKAVESLHEKPVDPKISFINEVKHDPNAFEEFAPQRGEGVNQLAHDLAKDATSEKELRHELNVQADPQIGLEAQYYIVNRDAVDPSLQGQPVTPEDIQQIGK